MKYSTQVNQLHCKDFNELLKFCNQPIYGPRKDLRKKVKNILDRENLEPNILLKFQEIYK